MGGENLTKRPSMISFSRKLGTKEPLSWQFGARQRPDTSTGLDPLLAKPTRPGQPRFCDAGQASANRAHRSLNEHASGGQT